MIAIRSDLTPAQWDEYARRGTLYHRHGFGQVLAEALGHRLGYFAALDCDTVVGILPVALVRSRVFGTFALSLPTVTYGGILAEGDQAARLLAEAARAWAAAQGARWVLLRQREAAGTGWPAEVSRATVVLPLAQAVFPDSRMRQVRHAERCGMLVRESTPEQFHPVFARCMRDLGTPALGLGYFRALARRFPQEVGCYVVTKGQAVLGGAVTIRHGASVEAPWACSLRAVRRDYPHMLLYHRLICEARQSGAVEFDFGRSAPDSGPYRFKRQWGGLPVALPWQYWSLSGQPPDTGADNPRFGGSREAWKRLPMPVAKALGAVIARWLP